MGLSQLGSWTVLDIETSGIDPNFDSIIDIGFLEFDGTKLVRKFNSLVHYNENLSQFIIKLTGISNKMLKKAPKWSQVENEVQELLGHAIIAHNASFEESFLAPSFEKISNGDERESYQDSLYFLGLLFPEKSTLKLDRFIADWKIRDGGEIHRGFEDSLDLLKVLLVAVCLVRRDVEKRMFLENIFKKYSLRDFWFSKFFLLSEDELVEISKQIDFDLMEQMSLILGDEKKDLEEEKVLQKNFSLDFNGENIKKIFSDEEKIKEEIKHYKYRKSQEELSLRVGQSFKNDIHALVQAPTGTGKTLGYLLPSILFSLDNKKQILISTGTKTLQHQAMSKDIPLARKVLGLGRNELKIRQLVGSNNHLCELLFRQDESETDLLFDEDDFSTKFSKMFFEMVFFHNSRVSGDKVILRGDLPYVLKAKNESYKELENEIGVDFRSCTGSLCPFKRDCSYIGGIREAKEADIVIGNHALMFNWPRAFARPQYIVVDEAHKIEDETTRAFSIEVAEDQINILMKNLQHLQGVGSLFYLLANNEEVEGESTPLINQIRQETQQALQMMQDHIAGLPTLIERYFKKMPRYTDTFWNESPMIHKAANSDGLAISIFNHFESLKHILEMYLKLLSPFTARWEPKEFEEEGMITAWTRFEKFYGGISDLVDGLGLCLKPLEERGNQSVSIRYHEKYGFCLNAAPVNIGQVIHDQLLETSSSVIFTSATLGNINGDQGAKGIEWATGYSYLAGEKRFRSGFYLPPVYDYENKTKVFLCDDVPAIWDNNFVKDILTPINQLIRDLKGRSLLLFSARSRFELAREILLKEFDGEIPLFIQGMGNDVVESFKQADGGILLGMESFGEGIDIPGDTLQFILVDKVPDMRMDLVIKDRRDFYETNLGNEFTDYYLGHRTRSLHQKLGRLLRTESDFGGIIIVDSRIKKWKGRTINNFYKLMEPYQLIRTSLDEACLGVKNFLDLDSE